MPARQVPPRLVAVFCQDRLQDTPVPPPGEALVVTVRFTRPDDTFADACFHLRELGRPADKLAWIDGVGLTHSPEAEHDIARGIARTFGIPHVTVYQERVTDLPAARPPAGE